jgi:hypothetical protein
MQSSHDTERRPTEESTDRQEELRAARIGPPKAVSVGTGLPATSTAKPDQRA